HDACRLAQPLPQGRPSWSRTDRRRKKFTAWCAAGSASSDGEIEVDSLAGAEPDACAQEFLRIDSIAIDAGFVMQMRTCRAPGGAACADHLADPDDIADLDVDLGEMAVARGESVAVIDLDHAAIAALPA